MKTEKNKQKPRIIKKISKKAAEKIATKLNSFIYENFPVRHSHVIRTQETEFGTRVVLVYPHIKEDLGLIIPLPHYDILCDSFYDGATYIKEQLAAMIVTNK